VGVALGAAEGDDVGAAEGAMVGLNVARQFSSQSDGQTSTMDTPSHMKTWPHTLFFFSLVMLSK
jgi:hypothetical protein